jgi:hypothetical protein
MEDIDIDHQNENIDIIQEIEDMFDKLSNPKKYLLNIKKTDEDITYSIKNLYQINNLNDLLETLKIIFKVNTTCVNKNISELEKAKEFFNGLEAEKFLIQIENKSHLTKPKYDYLYIKNLKELLNDPKPEDLIFSRLDYTYKFNKPKNEDQFIEELSNAVQYIKYCNKPTLLNGIYKEIQYIHLNELYNIPSLDQLYKKYIDILNDMEEKEKKKQEREKQELEETEEEKIINFKIFIKRLINPLDNEDPSFKKYVCKRLYKFIKMVNNEEIKINNYDDLNLIFDKGDIAILVGLCLRQMVCDDDEKLIEYVANVVNKYNLPLLILFVPNEGENFIDFFDSQSNKFYNSEDLLIIIKYLRYFYKNIYNDIYFVKYYKDLIKNNKNNSTHKYEIKTEKSNNFFSYFENKFGKYEIIEIIDIDNYYFYYNDN